MNNWNQQLNVAVWAATAGCGVGMDLLTAANSPERVFIISLLRFHVYYTTPRILRKFGAALQKDFDFDLK